MPRLLAFEYDDAEARVVVAASHCDRVTVEHAFCVALGESIQEAAVDVGQRLAAALAARGLGRLDALAALQRTQVELRQLVVPPCPDEELPELVRFQSMREFSALKDDWPLDFVPGEEGQQQRTVLAAAIEPGLAREINTTCDAAGVRLRRLILRPCAVASLWRRRGPATDADVCLLADLLGGEAELTVLVDGRESFLRSARLPGDPLADPAALAALISEIRRTMVAAQNQLGGRGVEAIVLCGSGTDYLAAAGQIGQQLAVPVTQFDPLEGLDCEDEVADTLPERPGRFAPLLGMLEEELRHERPAIDFLHPRRPPEPASPRRKYVLIGLIAAVLALAAFGYRTWATHSLQNEIDDLAGRSKNLKTRVAKAGEIEKSARAVGQWVDADLVWLDEWTWLVEHFPPSEEAMLSLMKIRSSQGGGRIELNGFARSVETIDTMDRKLRDGRHDVVGHNQEKDDSVRPYTFSFHSTVLIEKEDR